MVILKATGALVHPSLVAVTLIEPVIAVPVLFAGAVKIISPFPVVAIPMDALVLVHEITDPDTFEVNGIFTATPGQYGETETGATTG